MCFTGQNFDDLVSSENNLLVPHWFSIKPIATVKYELIVLFMYDSTNYRFQSQIWAHLLHQTLFFCVRITKGILSILTLYEKYTYSMKTLAKFTKQLCFVKQPNIWIDLLVCKPWKQTDFHLFTKTIPFSRKYTNRILNHFRHYLIPSATEAKINLFSKI